MAILAQQVESNKGAMSIDLHGPLKVPGSPSLPLPFLHPPLHLFLQSVPLKYIMRHTIGIRYDGILDTTKMTEGEIVGGISIWKL